MSGGASPRWMTAVLVAAGIYNILWGGLVMAFPQQLLALAGMASATYPEFLQCIGMAIAVFGLAYLTAAPDPLRHFPVLLAGLVGRILGPIGFVQGVLAGVFPWKAGLTILTNDLIWILPFAIMMLRAFRHWRLAAGQSRS